MVDDDAYAFARVTAESRVIVVFNHAAATARLHVPVRSLGIPDGTRLERTLKTTPAVDVRQGAVEVELAPHSVAIYVGHSSWPVR